MCITNIVNKRKKRDNYLKLIMIKILYKAEKHDIKQGLYTSKIIFDKDQFYFDSKFISLEELNSII
jgi:hypothetical protein